MRITHFIKNNFTFFHTLPLILMLVSLPLNFAYGSLSCILFLVATILIPKISKPNFRFELLLPISFYLLMVFSLFWTNDFNLSFAGLQKCCVILLIPIGFALMPKFNSNGVNQILRWFSFSMVIYAIYFCSIAIFKFYETNDFDVFFFHKLVSLDLNAIYIAIFSSLAMFYFVTLEAKNLIERMSLIVLIVFIFLLSSRSVFFINMTLIVYYYIFISKTRAGVKSLTVISVVSFFLFSIFFVPKLREKILSESETAFVDNVIHTNFNPDNEVTNNVSVNYAWNGKEFHHNNFFPGTALRVFQVRIFSEMLEEQNIFFTGFGHEASQKEIEKKIIEKKISLDYKIFNFHNQYIQTFAELGVLGFLILVTMLFVNLKNAIYNKNFLHLTFAFSMITLFLTESILCRQRGIFFFITLYCIFNTIEYKGKRAI